MLKVGVFLIGISALIISIILLHMYITQQQKYDIKDFYVNCLKEPKGFSITIDAYSTDLKNVRVINDNITLCEFIEIPKRSQEVCKVSGEGTYIISALIDNKEIKKVVYCRNYSYIPLD